MVSRTAAMELAGTGVRVNGIASGITDMGKTYEPLPKGLLANIGKIIPAGRLATEHDIAAAVSYLCSDGARTSTGTPDRRRCDDRRAVVDHDRDDRKHVGPWLSERDKHDHEFNHQP